MSTRNAAIGAIVLAAAMLTLTLWWGSAPPTPPPAPPKPRASERPSVEQTRPALPPPTAVTREAAAPASEPTLPEELMEPEEEAARPPEVVMPLAAKLVPGPLSEVPHEVLGAWDEQPDSPRPGVHRIFVAVVDASISDSDLEAFLRDISQRHRDAEVLDVRVYDSAEAARRPSYLDGGAERQRHLVAQIKRNDRLHFDSMEVRGAVVAP